MATTAEYRRPLFDPNDVLFMRCLTTCAIFAVLLVIAVQLIPALPPKPVVRVEELPQRFAKLILEPVKKAPPTVLPAGEQVHTAKKEPGGGGGGGGPAAQERTATHSSSAGRKVRNISLSRARLSTSELERRPACARSTAGCRRRST